MALNLQGGPNWLGNFVNAPIIVNATSQEYYKQPIFYALGHFSKFIVPGSARIDHLEKKEIDHDEDDTILATFFERPDQSSVLTVLNKNNHSVKLKLHDPASGLLVAELAANSLQSFIWH